MKIVLTDNDTWSVKVMCSDGREREFEWDSYDDAVRFVVALKMRDDRIVKGAENAEQNTYGV